MNFHLAIIFLMLSMLSSHAQDLKLARESHPHFPDDEAHFDYKYVEPSLTPASGVDALTKQEKWLRTQLERFPPMESRTSPPLRRFGYLSRRHEVASVRKPMNEWIQLHLNQTDDIIIEGVALIPAYFPEYATDSNYGFPKRFKIEVSSYRKPDEILTVVDWTQQDFPDPGLYPVIFKIPNLHVKNIKLTVTKGTIDGDMEFFALDEFMVFRSGNNAAPPTGKDLTRSGSSDIPPYWDIKYLLDSQIHLGKYLHAPQSVPDFIQPIEEAGQAHNPPEVTIDLGEVLSMGRIELHAAKDPNMPIPSIALPKRYKIEILKRLEPPIVVRSEWVEIEDSAKMRWHALYSKDGRYLRLTFPNLPVHNGQQILALGEIRVIGDQGTNKGNLAIGKPVTINRPSLNSATSTSLLVDGFTNGRKIVPERLYIEQLAKRAIVEKAHLKVIEKLAVAHGIQTQRYWTIGIATSILVLFALVLWLLRQKSERKKAVLAVQQQIAADLHDDISGNLGTISMISNRLRGRTDEPLTKEKLREIGHLSQESYISVKEIIWHTDSETLHLSDLLKQIKRTAQSILSDCRVSYDFPSQLNDVIVPVTMRRNIILLVKESLYNCAKYAQAENMLIRAQITDSVFTLMMRDDGCGFDNSCDTVANSESGRGLKNMEQRAKLLGADLTIHSSPGEGTEIRLNMPLTTK
jgi:signal transduction histidine kinase